MVTRLMHPVVMVLITLTRFVEKRSIIITMDTVSISTVMSTEAVIVWRTAQALQKFVRVSSFLLHAPEVEDRC